MSTILEATQVNENVLDVLFPSTPSKVTTCFVYSQFASSCDHYRIEFSLSFQTVLSEANYRSIVLNFY